MTTGGGRTYLGFINMSLYMRQVTLLLNKVGPSRREFHILDTSVLAFQLEVRIQGKYQCVQPSMYQQSSQLKDHGHFRRTCLISSGASFQSSGRLRPGWGQAGHSTASSPCDVPLAPAGSCPRPALLSINKWRQRRMTRRNSE